jgi:hypothetical protein
MFAEVRFFSKPHPKQRSYRYLWFLSFCLLLVESYSSSRSLEMEVLLNLCKYVQALINKYSTVVLSRRNLPVAYGNYDTEQKK